MFGYLPIMPVNARDMAWTSRDKQRQSRDKQGQDRNKKGQPGEKGQSLYVPYFPFFVPAYPCLSLPVPVCPCLGWTGTGRKHSSLVGGSAEEDKEVDKVGEEEGEEPPEV